MPNLLDTLDNSYRPTSAYSFEFRMKTVTGRIGFPLGEFFFLLPPENYSIDEGYKITANKTIGGAWIDDFGNDFKKINISGSLYSYYVGTPAKTTFAELNLPPFIRNMKNQTLGIANDLKTFANSGANAVGLDIPGLGIISGLDEFFKLRYVISRFRDNREADAINRAADLQILKKFPELGSLVSQANSGRKLFTDIAVIYHDYDDNNHYEVIFESFNMSRDSRDPFTINYKIGLTGVREFNNQFSGIGEAKRREDPFAVLSSLGTKLSEMQDIFSATVNLPATVLNEITKAVNLIGETVDLIIDIGSEFASDVTSQTDKLTKSAKDLKISIESLQRFTIENAFPDKSGEALDDVIEKFNNEEEGYLIEDENYLTTLSTCAQTILATGALAGTEKYFTDSMTEKTFETTDRIITDNDFELENSDDNDRQQSTVTTKNKIYYQITQGDTLQSLANKFYGDYTRYTIIAEANGITNKDFENDGLIGTSIEIPSLIPLASKQTEFNLVYFKRQTVATPKERQIQTLGNDIRLDQTGQIVVDGNGDVSLLYGEDCYMENIIDRISNVMGSLNQIHPEWGIRIAVGDIPAAIVLNKIYDNIEQQIVSDPRTEFAYVDRENSLLNSDTANIITHLKPINGAEQTINLGTIVAGLLI